MIKIVLLRHGESVWNKKNIFTGWTDVELSEKGIEEAHEAGKLLKEKGFEFDLAFTSVLKRATKTLDIVLQEMNLKIPIKHSWRLNEKHYGALQGLNKKETAQKFGEKQVLLWRRDYTTRPPALKKTDKRHPKNNPLYENVSKKDLPDTECLKDTVERFVPYWKNNIVPELIEEKKIIISAHGNSLRALVKHLDNISEKKITNLNIPTGIPLVYELDSDLKPLKHYYLGDFEAIKKAQEKVKNQGKK